MNKNLIKLKTSERSFGVFSLSNLCQSLCPSESSWKGQVMYRSSVLTSLCTSDGKICFFSKLKLILKLGQFLLM